MITFKTKHYANIMMFDVVGETLLKMMNTGGVIPGALNADDVESALGALEKALDAHIEPEEDLSDDDEKKDEPTVGLKQRAIPLIALLTAARTHGDGVMWEK